MRASPGEIDACYAAIENTVGAIANQRVVPVTLDGDEAIALPEMRALQKLSSGIVVVDLRESPSQRWAVDSSMYANSRNPIIIEAEKR